MESVALIGTGTMGVGMGGRLLDAGYPLTVWNRHPERAQPLIARGARLGASPADAAAKSDFIISMVADDAASHDVWVGERGILSTAKRGAIAIESSTVSPVWIRTLGASTRAAGCALLDAPVNGSRSHAAEGTLRFLVGGDPEVLERARPVLRTMSREIAHLGPLGSGALIKLVSNFLVGVQAASVAEAIAIIEQGGLDIDQSLEILRTGAPGSPAVETLSKRMAGRAYDDVNFRLALMAKDLSYAVAEGKRLGIDVTTASVAAESFTRAVNQGHGARDFSAVAEAVRSSR